MEHIAAYTIVGILFSAAYPRSPLLVCIFLLLFVAVFEAMQTFIPDRHGTLRDAAEKMLGGAAGVFFMTLALRWRKIRRIKDC
jgi:VanZ family protein